MKVGEIILLHEQIKNYLLTLQVGDQLPHEIDLAKKFTVSRGTIREAINYFTQLGLLERIPKRGTFIKKPGLDEISKTFALQLQVAGIGFEELKATRLLLETAIAPLLVKYATPRQLEQLKHLNQRMAALRDEPLRADEFDLRFHLTLIDICGNRIVMIMTQIMHIMFERKYRRKFLTPEAVDHSVKNHQRMIEFIKAEDASALAAVITEHIKPL